jgi:glycosyltransferase involved in cell wall biosynthesis
MRPSVTWMLPDKLGGVYNFAGNLLAHRAPDDLTYSAILARNLTDPDDPSDSDLQANVRSVSYRLPPENFHTVLRRLARSVPEGRGVIVANDWLSVAMASAHNTGKSIVYINHGDFQHYYDLALMHEPTIDLYITYTERMHNRLRELLPHRKEDILCIPYGVEIPTRRHRALSNPIRLLYVGRLDRSKGVFDLPSIDRLLRDSGLAPEWTIQGPGPAEHELREVWGNAPHVRWLGRSSMEQVKKQYVEHDILVMPSRSEGLPVALLEAMASGCVPVVSDLPSGIRETVENGVNGFRVAPGDITGFADAIISLDSQRGALRAMSDNAASRIESRFDIQQRAPEYQRAISGLIGRKPRWSQARVFHGSRLDRPWIPNIVVRSARSLRHGLRRLRRSSLDVRELPE